MSLSELWLRLRYQPDFLIRITSAEVSCRHGQVAARFLSECELIVQEAGLQRGTILGCNGRLHFAGLPAAIQQRVRNVWQLYRGP